MSKNLCATLEPNGWLAADADGIVPVPALIKGRLCAPPPVTRSQIDAAFSTADAAGTPQDTARVGDALILREHRPDGTPLFQTTPTVPPADLIETDVDRLLRDLYQLPHDEVLAFLERVGEYIADQEEALEAVQELAVQTSEHPRSFVEMDFSALPILFDRDIGRTMVDADLGAWGQPGHRFLDGWVDLPVEATPGTVHMVGSEVAEMPEMTQPRLRAMPTRQLHITAGNAPLIPIVSMMRALWTKSAAVIKLPFGATLLGSLFGSALATVAPDHPITRALSLLYWRGGDQAFEAPLWTPGAFDRIVVWGAPQAVASVRSRALFTKTLCFNPRYGVSMVGAESRDALPAVAEAAVFDSLVQNQKACIAAQVHYVEGDRAQAERYAEAVSSALARWDTAIPQRLTRWQRGQLTRLRRGALLEASWHANRDGKAFRSGAVVVGDDFDVHAHPMCRFVAVRPVDSLEDALPELTAAVSTVGVYPLARRDALADRIAARGVSQVVGLGEAGRTFPGMSHDGMMVLSELVDWKNG